MDFDINGPGQKGQMFGLPAEDENTHIELIAVPWDVTVSYKDGTSKGTQAILDASNQIDLFSQDVNLPWKLSVNFDSSLYDSLSELNSIYRNMALDHIDRLVTGRDPSDDLHRINSACGEMVDEVQKLAKVSLDKGKVVGCLGGDHSTPLGLLNALEMDSQGFGILQIDAHCDLRDSYEGFEYSHASIMFNTLKLSKIDSLIQVGIRDYCEEEHNLIKSDPRITTYFDNQIKSRMFEGNTWASICDEIVSQLPSRIYLSFDIDGLSPEFCPNTGTPVPGGLSFSEAIYLIKKLVLNGKQIIGFDLSEVAPSGQNDWDANVGARLLYYITRYVGVSNGLLNFK